jgi:hypothetical protein
MTMTFTTLKADIAETLQRDDLTTRIPEFIASAEMLIARQIRPRGFEVFVSSAFTAGSAGAVITAPERLITMINFVVLTNSAETATGNIRSDIQRRSYSFVRAYGRDQTVTGKPRFFCDMGQNNMLVAPSPLATFGFEMAYYEQLEPLGAGNATNWLTDYAPNLLLYGSLQMSAPYLKDDERIAVWQGMYKEYAAALTATEQVFQTSDASTPKKDVA